MAVLLSEYGKLGRKGKEKESLLWMGDSLSTGDVLFEESGELSIRASNSEMEEIDLDLSKEIKTAI